MQARRGSSVSRWVRRTAVASLALLGLVLVFERATRLTPPPDVRSPRRDPPQRDGEALRLGPSSLTWRGALPIMHLVGEPADLGYQHAQLVLPLMHEGEQRMIDLFSTVVPSPWMRWLIIGVVRARYRDLGDAFPLPRREEIFGETQGYRGPRAYGLSTYQRLVYLHGLYDIALAFERSPLLGCTSFAASGTATRAGSASGHTIVGRNFDFDIDPWFDEDKVVQIVEPVGKIPFASVSWPGMTGVVTGLNAEGLWISVNGGRAGELDRHGIPIVFTARAVLEEARTIDEALAVIGRDAPMASHLLLLADGKSGESVVVERAPGRPLGVLRDSSVTVLANHFRTVPLRGDPKNTRVQDQTTTLARQARIEELLRRYDGRVDPATAAAILRDRAGFRDTLLPLGNRNALAAMVASHSVIADATARVLWVSEGPHTLGRYRRIDLPQRLAHPGKNETRDPADDLPADSLLRDGTYDRYLAGTRLHRTAEALVVASRLREGRHAYHRALALRRDDHVAWRGLAELEAHAGRPLRAGRAWRVVSRLAPEGPAASRKAERASRAPAAAREVERASRAPAAAREVDQASGGVATAAGS